MSRWVTFAQGFLLAVLLLGRREFPDALHGAMIVAGITLNVWVLLARRRPPGDPECAAEGCELAEGHPRPHQFPPAHIDGTRDG